MFKKYDQQYLKNFPTVLLLWTFSIATLVIKQSLQFIDTLHSVPFADEI